MSKPARKISPEQQAPSFRFSTPSRLTEPTFSSSMKKREENPNLNSSFQSMLSKPKPKVNKENALTSLTTQPIDIFKSSNFSFIEMLNS
jgi:hypothetical protein